MTVAATPYRAILTGASGGIGQAVAVALAPSCEWLLLTGRNAATLQALQARLGPNVHVVDGDLTDPPTLAAIEDRARTLGGANLLVNNAGTGGFHAFGTQDQETIRMIVDANLIAPMLLTRQLLPQLLAAPAAQIINVGSLFGYIGYPGFAAYAASKSGLRGFTQALRRELADTAIQVRHFIPRATRTAINSAAVDALNRDLGTQVDLPEQAAAQLLAFLSGSGWEHKPGIKEALLVLINHLMPGLPDRAIHQQLPRIRGHMPK